jgi:crossover junction endodeoxyribonuclease RuvC
MRVLGIDPASAGTTGYGVVELQGGRCRLVATGGHVPPRRATPAERLRAVHELVQGLIQKHAPDALALESVFAAINVKSALKLAETRGVVMLAAAQAGVPVHSYSPREVKLSVAGYGHADKHQIQQMVRAELQLAELPTPADAADAIAVALCHIHTARAAARLARASGATASAASPPGRKPRASNSRFRAAGIQTQR